jgi:hypothetical protein
MQYTRLDETTSFKSFSHDKESFHFKIDKVLVRGNFFLSLYGQQYFLKSFLVRNPKKFGRHWFRFSNLNLPNISIVVIVGGANSDNASFGFESLV